MSGRPLGSTTRVIDLYGELRPQMTGLARAADQERHRRHQHLEGDVERQQLSHTVELNNELDLVVGRLLLVDHRTGSPTCRNLQARYAGGDRPGKVIFFSLGGLRGRREVAYAYGKFVAVEKRKTAPTDCFFSSLHHTDTRTAGGSKANVASYRRSSLDPRIEERTRR